MCTMMTVSREFYSKNKVQIRKRLLLDAVGNSDGYSMLVIGESAEDGVLIRSLNIELILTVLEYQMDSGATRRAWIHCRYATTGFVGLNGCHGFDADDYTVFHNGVLSRPTPRLNVDSELIAEDIQQLGVDRAIAELVKHDSYANVFIVNNKTGQYNVVRLISGSLYTDGQGNYSTNRFGAINRAVPTNTRTEFSQILVEYPTPQSELALPVGRPEFFYDAETGTEGLRMPSDSVSSGRVNDEFDPATELLDILIHVRSLEDMEDIAEYELWGRFGVPQFILDGCNSEQRNWIDQLGLHSARAVSAKAS